MVFALSQALRAPAPPTARASAGEPELAGGASHPAMSLARSSLSGARLSTRRTPAMASASRPVAIKVSSRFDGVAASASSTISNALSGAEAKRTELKEALLVVTAGGLEVTEAKRTEVNEILPKLEALNPTAAPVSSPDLNGTWQFVYTGGITPGFVPSPTRPIALLMYAGGFTVGQFGLEISGMLPDSVMKIKDFFLKIQPEQPRAEASVLVKVLNNPNTVKVRTNLEPQSDVRFRETYAEAETMGRSMALPDPLKFERQVFITYLDDDVLVARDSTGSPDILVRNRELDPPDEVYEEEEKERIYVTNSSDEG